MLLSIWKKTIVNKTWRQGRIQLNPTQQLSDCEGGLLKHKQQVHSIVVLSDREKARNFWSKDSHFQQFTLYLMKHKHNL